MGRKCIGVSACWRVQRLMIWMVIVANRIWSTTAVIAVDIAPQPHQSPVDQNSDADAADAVDVADPELFRPANPRQVRWATAAYEYIIGVDCQRNAFSTEHECIAVQTIERHRWNVYLADPQPPTGNSRLRHLHTTLPDGSFGDSSRHHRVDGVVVLDPYPDANFGHLVIVFHVTIAASASWCRRRDGFLIGDGDCMVLALKRRCSNAVDRRSRRRNLDRRCEVNFIPLVTGVDFDEHQEEDHHRRHRHWRLPRAGRHGHLHRGQQLLTCRDNIPGFSASCPTLPPHNDTDRLCNPVRENARRCETTHAVLQRSARCRLFEICDRAIVVSGGWNRWSQRSWHADNAARVYAMLRDHGFTPGNVKVFFANGDPDIIKYGNESSNDVHPAALKLVIRYHIRNLCSTQHCVDSLVIYLNSPTTSDGTMLLWDADHNGVASRDERYTLAELKSDLSNCRARYVHVVVDQSYAGTLVRTLRRSRQLQQVAVYASSRDSEYSFSDDFTTAWTRLNQTRACMKDVFREARRSVNRSHPQLHVSESSPSSGVNVFGAPCDVVPPFTHNELQLNYVGCQNLPTALWVMKLRHSSSPAAQTSSSTSSNADRTYIDDMDWNYG